MLVYVLPPVAVSLVVTLSLHELLHYRSLGEDLTSKAAQVAEVNSRVLASSIWFLNVETLKASFLSILEDEDFVAVVVVESDQNVTAWSVRSGSGILDGQGELPQEVDLTGIARSTRPVFFGQPGRRDEIAKLTVYYTRTSILRRLGRRLVIDAVFLAFVLAASTASLVLALRRTVEPPVAAMTASIRNRRSEEGYHQVDWSYRDELGGLVRELNDMLASEVSTKTERDNRLGLYETALDHIRQGVCIFDRDFRLAAYNRRYAELLGYDESVLQLGTSLSTLLKVNAEKGEYGAASLDALVIDRLAIAAGGERYHRERERSDGTTLEIDSNPLPDGGFVSVYTELTERKEYEKKLRHMTLHDTLTDLPNRALFYDRLRQALMAAERLEHRLAVVMVDVDGFRLVNETQGREVGDFVLRGVAERLRRLLRKSDTVARLEADVFAVIQQHLVSIDQAAFLAHRILGCFARPFETADIALRLTASIGMTIYPDDDRGSEYILRHAHLALHAAKAEGRNRYRYFVPEMDRAVATRRRLEQELFTALREQQFVLHFQPKVDLETGAVVGAEALVRWQHPERGLLAPIEFLQLAEDRGLIVPLTEWILEEACRQRQQWRGVVEGRMAVNLSALHFSEGDVVESVTAALTKTALDHQLLEVEVTEIALLQNPGLVAASLQSLRDLGVGAVVDDFGTGYSSMSSLHRFPIDAIKIDRRFVHGFGSDDEASKVVRAVIFLSRKLNLGVVAEGVENEKQLQLLKAEGCSAVQGNYFSPPLTGEEFLSWLEGRPAAATAGAGLGERTGQAPRIARGV